MKPSILVLTFLDSMFCTSELYKWSRTFTRGITSLSIASLSAVATAIGNLKTLKTELTIGGY